MQITLTNLTKIFNNNKKIVTAVDKISYTIPSGKLIGLLGPSGCGKSTILFMIAGLHEVTEGEIWFGEENVTNLASEKRGIGLVFQNYALYPHMTVSQNIMFPLENLKVPKDEAVTRVAEMAKLVDIHELLDRKPKKLSGGQQQRVAIARALVKRPRVLLLDEPLSNLDARLRLQTREEIKRIQRETGITTIFVTHDQEEAMSISDEIIVMNEGIQQQIGHPQDVYEEPKNLFVAKFLGMPPINLLQASIKNGKVYVGNDIYLENVQLADNPDVILGVRAEGFILSKTGFEINSTYTEVIGRDASIIYDNPNKLSEVLRIIVNTDLIDRNSTKFSFSIKANKAYIFDSQTHERLLYNVT